MFRGKVKCDHARLFVGMDRGKVARCMDDETVAGMLYIRKTTLHLLSLHDLNSVEISLESLWHLKVQPHLHVKLKAEFKRDSSHPGQ